MQLYSIIQKSPYFVKPQMYFCGKHLSFSTFVFQRNTAQAQMPELQTHSTNPNQINLSGSI